MTPTGPTPAGAGTAGARPWARTIASAAAAGTGLAIIVVYAYYNDPWRPLAHVLGPWAVLATAVAFRRPRVLAVAASVSALAAAVVTFTSARRSATTSAGPVPTAG